ncbi:MAG TPA: hypothetical protein VNO55_18980 [Polyangia bacterium]|nr:hypothetical protein [Polyangia bacterium]
MSSPRLVVIVTAVLFAAHAAVLTTLGTAGRGPLASNSLQLALGIVCVMAPLVAARGSVGFGFEQRFLYLMAARYLIWTVAQGLSIAVPEGDAPYQESMANVLFHLEDLPMGVALLLDVPVHDADRPAPVRLVELGQMAVFLGAVVLYAVYSPTSPASGVGLLPSTDAIIASGFYARALLSRSPVAGALFGRFTPFILLSAINHSYAGHLAVIPETGDLFDLVWSVENVVWILTAVTWGDMNKDRRAHDGIDDGVGFPLADVSVRRLPLVAACFSVAMSLGVVSCQRPLGVALLIAAVTCTAVSVGSQRREATR